MAGCRSITSAWNRAAVDSEVPAPQIKKQLVTGVQAQPWLIQFGLAAKGAVVAHMYVNWSPMNTTLGGAVAAEAQKKAGRNVAKRATVSLWCLVIWAASWDWGR